MKTLTLILILFMTSCTPSNEDTKADITPSPKMTKFLDKIEDCYTKNKELGDDLPQGNLAGSRKFNKYLKQQYKCKKMVQSFKTEFNLFPKCKFSYKMYSFECSTEPIKKKDKEKAPGTR
ncbi:hypothetical protein A9Q84_14155 [Halobacteriovorax marinus]|uniref:Lipoprotein n=1 Tax=Halobacteriovorax marinus TaxID=97084 RepID=A0A1Y5F4Q9_9BACT|nr:hypothetical protein A9Q84_14155 [Halobacteriovorax marinus]